MSITEYQGRCFCHTVQLRVVGEPVSAGYCHCASCRTWSASPVNAFTLWAPSAVTITAGLARLGSYSNTDRSIRKWCKNCGGHVLTEHPGLVLTDVFAATIPEFPFRPIVHVNYSESVLAIRDGLPKLPGMPKWRGASEIVLRT
ncbi:MAG: GFA family protein [Kofleriaceae bacterium]|nr:GFA family protein [Kofleriaceae bacterium]